MLNNLNHFFNVVNVFDDLLHLFHYCNFLHNLFHFNELVSDLCYWYYFFPFNLNLSDSLYNSGHLNYFLYHFLNVLIDFDDLGHNSFHLNDLRHLDEFLNNFLDFVNAGNSGRPFNNFLNDLLSSDDFLNFGLDSDNFLYNRGNFLNDLLDVRNYPLNFFDSFIDHYLFDDLLYILDPHIVLFGLDDLFNKLGHLYYFLKNLSYWHHFLHNHLHWHCYLFRHYYDFLNFNRFDLFKVLWDYFINVKIFRHLIDD